jgi:hypothetical protein
MGYFWAGVFCDAYDTRFDEELEVGRQRCFRPAEPLGRSKKTFYSRLFSLADIYHLQFYYDFIQFLQESVPVISVISPSQQFPLSVVKKQRRFRI